MRAARSLPFIMSDPQDRSPPLAPPPSASGDRAVTQTGALDAVTVHPSVTSSHQRIDSYVGKTLEGRYVVESLLGEGGMGYVYLGRHKLIEKRVAIKILRGDMAADQEMTERFLNEAKAASSIGNPHIVDISDFGRLPDGAAFFVMEFLDGQSLSELLTAAGVVAVPRLVHISMQIARALQAAHDRGIVHRDLKPENIMLIPRGEDRDFVKVLDFGIAKVGGENARITRAGSIFGTPHYMSPEQAAGVPVDQRTDIYALGVILYEMAAGKVPFDADNFMGILTQHMYKAPAPIRAVVPQPQEVPPGLEAVVLKALSKKVELRYQTMDELVLDLERVERGMVPDAVPEMMSRSGGFNVPADYFRNPQRGTGGAALMPGTPGSPKRRGILLGVIAGTILLLGVIGAVLIVSSIGRNVGATSSPNGASLDPLPGPAVSTQQPQATPAKISVTVTTEPVDATIAIDDDRADAPRSQPRTFELGPDDKLTLRVERAGYKTLKPALDAKKLEPLNARIALKLERDVTKVPAVPPSRPATTKATASAPAAPPLPSPPPPRVQPASTARPEWCGSEDWDMFELRCRKPQPPPRR